MPDSFAAAYRAAQQLAGGACPIEAGLLGHLPTTNAATAACPATQPTCGCWPQETRAEPELAHPRRRRRRSAQPPHRSPAPRQIRPPAQRPGKERPDAQPTPRPRDAPPPAT